LGAAQQVGVGQLALMVEAEVPVDFSPHQVSSLIPA